MTDSNPMSEAMNTAKSILDERMAEAESDWRDVAIAVENCPRVLLHGPPGTGKSYTHISTAQKRGVDLYKLTVDQETPGLLLVGMYLPNEAGGCSFHYGPCSMAMKAGAVLGLDEIDKMSGDALVQCYSVLDDPESAKLTLSNNETISPAPGFQCIATTNEVPTVLPEALLDRFDCVLLIKYANPAVFESRAWHCETLREAAKRALYLSDEPIRGNGGRRVGLRAFLAIDRMLAKGLELGTAARLVLGIEGSRWLCTAIDLAKADS